MATEIAAPKPGSRRQSEKTTILKTFFCEQIRKIAAKSALQP
jgi:hypothetical protein